MAIADERCRLRLAITRPPGPVRKYDVSDEKLAELLVAGMTDANRAS